jgi:putative DNA primase/helicase
MAADDLREKLATPEHTDIWNGEKFAAMYGDRFRYLTDREAWLMWDGARWRDAVEGDLVRAAEEVVKVIFALGMTLPAGDERTAMINWARKSAERRGITSMIFFGSSSSALSARSDQFDRHANLVNVANGTLDLRTAVLRPHAREDYLTTMTPIRYDQSATAPRWGQFLREIFVKKDDSGNNIVDEELIAFVQRAVGYTLTGHTREHAFFVLHGVGRNGKGRFIRMANTLLGDAAKTTHFKTFTALSSTSMNSPAVASLAGARLVTAGEPDEGVELSESLIKSLTGEDEIEAMAKYEAPFRYTPRFKIWFHCNHKPQIRGTDEGIWSRPRMIPFNVRFDDIDGKGTDARDMNLDDKLDAEVEGIFAWAVRGAMEWFDKGLGSAPSVKNATDDYRLEQDTIGAFIEECFVFNPEQSVAASVLQQTYISWCKENGTLHPLSPNSLKGKIDGRSGIRYKRTGDGRKFLGIRAKNYGDKAWPAAATELTRSLAGWGRTRTNGCPAPLGLFAPPCG